ncbi:DUF924 domain-containing protein [Shewanella sp. Choline-02u-19]|jgi:uncharacterized protein (DUF924 family)|uniref:DUF924 family protein n=1 Tax=unclassified Shewanella TaxID=196818 RepID=UPI000C3297EC|nr:MULTISPECIES: DUF924 family protein [unclassified Shewanella]PKG57028.1 DUF924 domain-containing protein [Shewanella sp. GutDb-MelDb]PKG76703.1 DUF924 domain-containing protein [Shewanella sp. GutCb]PKH54540.1 DUF924 domain-containing protein [Shewanella sp. Bg11-22]PKI28598.1 DUF924 domain-containing protein [Shewanella sp. Choline-02u-19]
MSPQNSHPLAEQTPVTPNTILTFWFEEIEPKLWWVKDTEFDALIKQRFEGVLTQAMAGELYHWRATPEGRLAEIIVLDQFSRNIYRDTPQSFAADPIALVLAQEAVALNSDSELKAKQVPFLLMPYMHSESLPIHEVAMRLFSREAAQGNLEFERRHKAIIEQFGRYPHRNAILERSSTEAEIAFLTQPGSSF